MVSEQIIARGVSDPGVLQVMRELPRHLFVEEPMAGNAYDDCALGIGEGQTISQPYMVAAMTELLGLTGTERVLEVGTGSGYQTAILAALAREVFTVERIGALSTRAEEVLKSLAVTNVAFRVSDGTMGWPEEAPFDRILITAGAPALPEALLSQLAEGGVIVGPVGERRSQVLVRGVMRSGNLKTEDHTACVFVPLLGVQGWDAE